MTKFILTTSILSLFALPAYAADDSLLSKLERGLKAEANTQLQGVAGGALKEIAPAAVQRAVKPAANDLIKKSVNASPSVINQDDIKAAQSPTQDKAQPVSAASVTKGNTGEGKVVSSSTGAASAILMGDTDSLFVIPAYDGNPIAGRLCNTWSGPGCIEEDRNWLKRRYPDQKTGWAVHVGVRAIWDERNAWMKVYSPDTGALDFSRASEVELDGLFRTVNRTNELIGKGLIHRDTLTFRECIKQKLPSLTKPNRTSKADVCG